MRKDTNMPDSSSNIVPLLGKVPCPHCGKPTFGKSLHPLLKIPGLGLAGFVFIFPLTAKQHCDEHGEINFEDFPQGSSTRFWIRRLIFMGAGSVALALLACLLIFLISLRNR